jgi:hypothetical protein
MILIIIEHISNLIQCNLLILGKRKQLTFAGDTTGAFDNDNGKV